jgi:hypothetical protein
MVMQSAFSGLQRCAQPTFAQTSARITVAQHPYFGCSHSWVTGRYDLRLPDHVIETLQLEALLQPILSRLETVMGHPKPRIRTHNVVFVPVGGYPDCTP